MSVVKLDQVDFSNISVDDPIKQENLYLSKIHYNNKDLVIQTPKLTVVGCNGNDNIEVKINEDLKSFLDGYDQFMINITTEKSSDWFSKELSKYSNQLEKLSNSQRLHKYIKRVISCAMKSM